MAKENGGSYDIFEVLRALGRAIGALATGHERHESLLLGIDDKFADLERRVEALEAEKER